MPTFCVNGKMMNLGKGSTIRIQNERFIVDKNNILTYYDETGKKQTFEPWKEEKKSISSNNTVNFLQGSEKLLDFQTWMLDKSSLDFDTAVQILKIFDDEYDRVKACEYFTNKIQLTERNFIDLILLFKDDNHKFKIAQKVTHALQTKLSMDGVILILQKMNGYSTSILCFIKLMMLLVDFASIEKLLYFLKSGVDQCNLLQHWLLSNNNISYQQVCDILCIFVKHYRIDACAILKSKCTHDFAFAPLFLIITENYYREQCLEIFLNQIVDCNDVLECRKLIKESDRDSMTIKLAQHIKIDETILLFETLDINNHPDIEFQKEIGEVLLKRNSSFNEKFETIQTKYHLAINEAGYSISIDGFKIDIENWPCNIEIEVALGNRVAHITKLDHESIQILNRMQDSKQDKENEMQVSPWPLSKIRNVRAFGVSTIICGTPQKRLTIPAGSSWFVSNTLPSKKPQIEKYWCQDDFPTDQCVICLDQLSVGTFLPCSHKVACMDCGKKWEKCPLCQKQGDFMHISFVCKSQRIFV